MSRQPSLFASFHSVRPIDVAGQSVSFDLLRDLQIRTIIMPPASEQPETNPDDSDLVGQVGLPEVESVLP